jgi:hypothetical protein
METNMTDYETTKAARTEALAIDPKCAIAHFVKYFTDRGYAFTIQYTDAPGDNGSLCKPKTTDVLEIIRAVYEIEYAEFSITDRDGNRAGYAVFMYPSDSTCSPLESVSDYGVTPTSEAWSQEWDAIIDRFA